MKNLLLASLLISVLSTATAIAEKMPANTSGNGSHDAVLNKTAVGDQKTAAFADKLVTVKRGATVDPYTGTSDRKNFAGKEPIAPHQVPVEKSRH